MEPLYWAEGLKGRLQARLWTVEILHALSLESNTVPLATSWNLNVGTVVAVDLALGSVGYFISVDEVDDVCCVLAIGLDAVCSCLAVQVSEESTCLAMIP